MGVFLFPNLIVCGMFFADERTSATQDYDKNRRSGLPEAMKNRAILILFLAGLAVFSLSGCSRSFRPDELRFGIWASQNDLWDEAVFRWKKILEQDPNSIAAHNNLAVAYEKKGLWEEARKEYESALKLAPKNEQVKSNYEKFKENREALKKEIEKDKAEDKKDKDKKTGEGGPDRS